MPNLVNRISGMARLAVHCSIFITLAISMTTPGHKLVDVGQSSAVDIESLSFIFKARPLGYILGTIIGILALDRVKKQELITIFNIIVLFVGARALSYVKNFLGLIIMFIITGFSMGFSNSVINANYLGTYGKETESFLQSLAFTYGTSGFYGLLLGLPLLIDPRPSISLDLVSDSTKYNVTCCEESQIQPGEILANAYDYKSTGMIIISVFTCFIFLYFLSSTIRGRKNTNMRNIAPSRVNFILVVANLSCIQVGLFTGVELGFAQIFESYVVELNRGVFEIAGIYANIAYWGGYIVTRGVSLLLAWKMNLKFMFVFDSIISFPISVMLLISESWLAVVVFMGTVSLGVSIALLLPSLLSLSDKCFDRIAFVVALVSCILEMIIPVYISFHLGSRLDIMFHIMALMALLCSGFSAIFIAILIRSEKQSELASFEEQELVLISETTAPREAFQETAV